MLPQIVQFNSWSQTQFTRFLSKWHADLSRGISINGVAKCPNETDYHDVHIILGGKKKLFLKFRKVDLYLVAIKSGDTQWIQFRASQTDEWPLPETEADKLDIWSSYTSLRRKAGYDTDITQMKSNKSALQDSLLDILNPNCTKQFMARAILRILLYFPESMRFTQIEEHARDRLLTDDKVNRHDAFCAYDGGLNRLITNWKNISRIAASGLGNDVEPPLLATYQLTTIDGKLIRLARPDTRLGCYMGHVTLTIEG